MDGQLLIKILDDNAPEDDYLYFCHLMSIFNDDEKHCAIFCNLGDDFLELRDFLSISNQLQSTSFKLYFMLLNVIIEKVITIKKIISYDENFENLTKIRRWTNFFKHPKSFFYIHHPQYLYNQLDDTKGQLIIDTDFVLEYYKVSNKNKDEELRKILINQVELKVLLPNLEEITIGFCKDINTLISTIKNNKDYVEKLMPHNINIENYYEKD